MAEAVRLVGHGMSQEPYRSARRVFWIMDNGSAHCGPKAADRLRSQRPSVVLVHAPLHASWLHQIEIYFSIVQRKVLTPNDFSSLRAAEDRLQAFQQRYQQIAASLQWTFTRKDRAGLMTKLNWQALARAA